jgi:hypothetical protein
MHLAWVDRGEGRHQGQMAVYVMPRGRLGDGYMALIKPFRYWVVYPALLGHRMCVEETRSSVGVTVLFWENRTLSACGTLPSTVCQESSLETASRNLALRGF